MARGTPEGSLDSLVSGLSHEVRNLVFGVSAGIDVLESEHQGDPELKQVTEQMREQLERLRGLLEEFRLFLSPLEPRAESLDPGPLIEAAVAHTAGPRGRRRATLEYAAEPDLPRISVDPVLFERAAQLLLTEALNRSPEGSPLGLEIRVEEGGAWLRVAVRHAGKPVPDGRLTASWEPFAVRYGAGSGLGLAIVRRIAEAHGGGVLSESLGAGGARYGLRLPVSRAARG